MVVSEGESLGLLNMTSKSRIQSWKAAYVYCAILQLINPRHGPWAFLSRSASLCHANKANPTYTKSPVWQLAKLGMRYGLISFVFLKEAYFTTVLGLSSNIEYNENATRKSFVLNILHRYNYARVHPIWNHRAPCHRPIHRETRTRGLTLSKAHVSSRIS